MGKFLVFFCSEFYCCCFWHFVHVIFVFLCLVAFLRIAHQQPIGMQPDRHYQFNCQIVSLRFNVFYFLILFFLCMAEKQREVATYMFMMMHQGTITFESLVWMKQTRALFITTFLLLFVILASIVLVFLDIQFCNTLLGRWAPFWVVEKIALLMY